ncbi:MAG: DUF4112 domain-containing protein [Lysobacterales bacterium]|nr:MAG: DUF4112 domain-containing protein [Xanthomonadales bacterium]
MDVRNGFQRLRSQPEFEQRPDAARDGIERLAWWLDSAIAVPGTRFRVGFDALVGLIPGIGDVAGMLMSSYIIGVAARQGAPPAALARMAINVALETFVGAVPILGDIFDAIWRANERNVRLLRRHRVAPQAVRRQSRAVVAAWVAGSLVVVLAVAVVAFVVLRWLIREVGAAF